jgi:endonuclease G
MVNGTEERTEDFRPDSAVSTGSAELSDYKSSGYDRGHLCPAGDMKISHTAMSESFYLSNMSPQVPSFNRGIWETLESTVRNIVCHDSEIYVVTGPIFKNNKGFIGANRVTIPGYYYKVIYSPKNKKMIGFVLPNEKCEKEIKDFSVSVDDVEKLSGINFFPKLAPSLENTLESKFDISKWDLTPMPETVSK